MLSNHRKNLKSKMIKKFNIDRSLYCDCSVFLIAGFSAMRYQNKIARSNVCALILNFRKSMFRYRSLYSTDMCFTINSDQCGFQPLMIFKLFDKYRGMSR